MSLTITATCVDITGTDNAGWATFELVGYGAILPRVSGSSCIALGIIKASANGSGAISQIILPNDSILPSGTTYVVNIYNASGGLMSSGRYSLTGSGTVDLSSLTPLPTSV